MHEDLEWKKIDETCSFRSLMVICEHDIHQSRIQCTDALCMHDKQHEIEREAVVDGCRQHSLFFLLCAQENDLLLIEYPEEDALLLMVRGDGCEID